MVQTCVAFRCTYKWKTGDGIHLHKFSKVKDPGIRKRWMKACRYWDPNEDDRVCSQHFLPSDYITPTSRSLKDDAVPSVFTNFLASTPRKRPAPKDRSIDTSTSSSSFSSSASEVSFDISVVEEPAAKKLKIVSPSKEELKTKLALQTRKIKSLQQKIRRRNSKIKNLEDMYRELVQKNLLHENFAQQFCTPVFRYVV